MPGNELPLNIFEPRYLNMVEDALGTQRMLGMIQPDLGDDDGAALCRTGCAGRITQYRETADGRIEMALTGVCRYDIAEELPGIRGYRVVKPDWTRFAADYAATDDLLGAEKPVLLRGLRAFFESKQYEAEWPMLEKLSTLKLVDTLTMALPLSNREKQLLLETVAPADRLQTFLALLDAGKGLAGSETRH